jgi:hypothetical protein
MKPFYGLKIGVQNSFITTAALINLLKLNEKYNVSVRASP